VFLVEFLPIHFSTSFLVGTIVPAFVIVGFDPIRRGIAKNAPFPHQYGLFCGYLAIVVTAREIDGVPIAIDIHFILLAVAFSAIFHRRGARRHEKHEENPQEFHDSLLSSPG